MTDLEYQERSKCRAINRYVWHQIRNLISSDDQLGKIIRIDKDGIVRVNYESKLLNDEQKQLLETLIANERDGVYRNKQLKDLEKKAKSQKDFNKWFDEEAMTSYMQTIPTKEVFYSDPVELYHKIKGTHTSDELNRQDFGGYSVWQTIYAFDIINPILVGTVLSGKVEIVDKGIEEYAKFNFKRKDLYGRINGNDLYEMKNNKLVKLDDTIHTLLFRHYKEPIYTTLNSMMLPIGGYRVMPSEGMWEDPRNPELEEETRKVLASENYKALKKRFALNYSRVSPRGY